MAVFRWLYQFNLKFSAVSDVECVKPEYRVRQHSTGFCNSLNSDPKLGRISETKFQSTRQLSSKYINRRIKDQCQNIETDDLSSCCQKLQKKPWWDSGIPESAVTNMSWNDLCSCPLKTRTLIGFPKWKKMTLENSNMISFCFFICFCSSNFRPRAGQTSVSRPNPLKRPNFEKPMFPRVSWSCQFDLKISPCVSAVHSLWPQVGRQRICLAA